MRAAVGLVSCSLLVAIGCGEKRDIPERTEQLRVSVRMPNGDPAPGLGEPPLPLTTGISELMIDIEALRADGSVDASFDGFVRVSVEPGTLVELSGEPGATSGRNALLLGGEQRNLLVRLGNARGETRVWAEDIGYVPGDPLATPACANGIDDDGDGMVDHPEDPGCAFANDDTETGGTHATGVSPIVNYALPRVADLQGLGPTSPYDQEGVEVEARVPAELVVTRIASDGFYATDLSDPRGFNHVFAFTFNTPGGLRVCDRIEKLSGTTTEFFGFTELSFPSFERHAWVFPELDGQGNVIALNDGPCRVPEPTLIGPPAIDPGSDVQMEPLESGLVRIEDVRIGQLFGPQPALDGQFNADRSNCDLDLNGLIDFDTPGSPEAKCADDCAAQPECVEWSAYAARGNYRVIFNQGTCAGGACTMQINTRSVSQFSPPDFRGRTLAAVSGTLRNFSGGRLNWTIETRCSADLVCDNPPDFEPKQAACDEGPPAPVSSQIACVLPRTIHDNEAID